MKALPRISNSPRLALGRTCGSTVLGLIACLLGLLEASPLGAVDEFEEAPIRYSKTTPRDPVARLQERIERGEWSPDRSTPERFLRALLRELEIPLSSQVLVFSKTSLQIDRISPRTPRAIFFSDDVYIGWVQGGPIEIASIDPELGSIFYLVEPGLGAGGSSGLRFERDAGCLSCHAGPRTQNNPGLLMRSVHTDRLGFPIFSQGSYRSSLRSPFKERWGGWYVTGQAQSLPHLGNIFTERDGNDLRYEPETGLRLENLANRFPTKRYPAKSSDVVALFVLAHQVSCHNALTRAAYRTRQALYREDRLRDELGVAVGARWKEATEHRIEKEAEILLEELLFFRERPLPEKIQGGKAFQADFLLGARRDQRGRSLRDFDLETRLFKRRLSFLVQSESFDSLPPRLLELVYRKLHDLLTAEQAPEKYAYLGIRERFEIRKILEATKKNLPEGWGQRKADGIDQR